MTHPPPPYTLPDGSSLSLPALFLPLQPLLAALPAPLLSQHFPRGGALVVSGGPSLYRGFPERVQRDLAWQGAMEVEVVAHKHRGVAAWRGASATAG